MGRTTKAGQNFELTKSFEAFEDFEKFINPSKLSKAKYEKNIKFASVLAKKTTINGPIIEPSIKEVTAQT